MTTAFTPANTPPAPPPPPAPALAFTAADLAAVLARYPRLTDSGMGLGRHPPATRPEREAVLAKGRADLAAHLEQCGYAALWMGTKRKTRTFCDRWTSYGLKHLMEEEVGVYVSNGEFIVGCLFAGFDVRPCGDSLNVEVNVSLRDLPDMNELWKRNANRTRTPR